MKVSVPFFFEGGPTLHWQPDSAALFPAYVTDLLTTIDGLALARAFTRINDPKVRRSIVRLVEGIASDDD